MAESAQEIIVKEIIEGLEQGLIPRKQTRITRGQKNLESMKGYLGFNQLLLSFIAGKRGCSNYRLTYKQMKAKGGTLKEGAEPARVCFYKRLTLDTKHKNRKGEEVDDQVPMLRYYIVYNLSDIDGIEIPEEEKIEELTMDFHDRYGEAKKYADNQGIEIVHNMGEKTCYNITIDKIYMPDVKLFESENYYLETLFHEITHSTGAEKRLKRNIANHFGNEDYSKEELVAEIGSAILCNEYGIDVDKQNKQAYINGRVKALKDKPSMIITAGNKAFKAVEFYFDNVKK